MATLSLPANPATRCFACGELLIGGTTVAPNGVEVHMRCIRGALATETFRYDDLVTLRSNGTTLSMGRDLTVSGPLRVYQPPPMPLKPGDYVEWMDLEGGNCLRNGIAYRVRSVLNDVRFTLANCDEPERQWFWNPMQFKVVPAPTGESLAGATSGTSNSNLPLRPGEGDLQVGDWVEWVRSFPTMALQTCVAYRVYRTEFRSPRWEFWIDHSDPIVKASRWCFNDDFRIVRRAGQAKPKRPSWAQNRFSGLILDVAEYDIEVQ